MRNLSLAVTLLMLAGAPAARAADLAVPFTEAAGYDECAGANALARIKYNFAWAERKQWHRGFVIASIGNPRPSGHPYAEPGLIHRDYCVADAIMTDGTQHEVYYVIEHGQGFAGIGSDVDSCVPGLDPWHVHDGHCRTVR